MFVAAGMPEGVCSVGMSCPWFSLPSDFFFEHFFEVRLMTGCNRVFALFPYLPEFVPMFWCSTDGFATGGQHCPEGCFGMQCPQWCSVMAGPCRMI